MWHPIPRWHVSSMFVFFRARTITAWRSWISRRSIDPPTKGGGPPAMTGGRGTLGVGRPTCPVGLWSSIASKICTIDSKAVWSWSRELTRINNVALNAPYSISPYKRTPRPPQGGHLIQIKTYHKWEISTTLSRCRSRIVELGVREIFILKLPLLNATVESYTRRIYFTLKKIQCTVNPYDHLNVRR